MYINPTPSYSFSGKHNYCPSCGRKNANHNYCPECGTSLFSGWKPFYSPSVTTLGQGINTIYANASTSAQKSNSVWDGVEKATLTGMAFVGGNTLESSLDSCSSSSSSGDYTSCGDCSC